MSTTAPEISAVPKLLLLWDGSPHMHELAAAADLTGLQQPSTFGIAKYVEQLCGLNSPAHAGARTYEAIASLRYTPERRATVEASAARVSMSCVWPVTGATDFRYGLDTYRQAAAGRYDDALRAALDTYPIGRNRPAGARPVRVRWAFCHEADGYSPAGTDTRAFVAAVQHLVMVVAEHGLRMGATPDELGVGGLLTGNGMVDADWWWFAGLPQWVRESGFLVGFWDTYFKVDPITADTPGASKRTADGKWWIPGAREFSTRPGELVPYSYLSPVDGLWYRPEPFAEKVERQIATFEREGLDRFVLAETALGMDTRKAPDVLVGSNAMHLAWWAEGVHTLRSRRGFEALMHFHKDDGPASKHGGISDPGRELVAKTVGWRQRDLNRAAA